MLQIPLSDKEYAFLKKQAHSKGEPARKYAYSLLFKRLSRNVELTGEQVAEIKQIMKNSDNTSVGSLARIYGVSRYRIKKIEKENANR
jgi:DNA-directed RNA polymerase sigma subunit (sigma70/sigma32)